jgi:hypothetical protein
MSEPQPSREIDLDEEDLELREEDEEVDGEEQALGTEPDAKESEVEGPKEVVDPLLHAPGSWFRGVRREGVETR